MRPLPTRGRWDYEAALHQAVQARASRRRNNRRRTSQPGTPALNFVIGLIVALGCMLGGFAAMGGHLNVIWQPWEFVIIGGSALGTFIVANSVHVIKDTGKALLDALLGRSPSSATTSTCWACCTPSCA